jgi:hypothetical protein
LIVSVVAVVAASGALKGNQLKVDNSHIPIFNLFRNSINGCLIGDKIPLALWSQQQYNKENS